MNRDKTILSDRFHQHVHDVLEALVVNQPAFTIRGFMLLALLTANFARGLAQPIIRSSTVVVTPKSSENTQFKSRADTASPSPVTSNTASISSRHDPEPDIGNIVNYVTKSYPSGQPRDRLVELLKTPSAENYRKAHAAVINSSDYSPYGDRLKILRSWPHR